MKTGAILILGCAIIGAFAELNTVPISSHFSQAPHDVRLGPPKDLNGSFPFCSFANVESWRLEADKLRRNVAVALGLWPMPDKTPLNPVVRSRVDAGAYSVEKVHFESLPGLFVAGNLYRPKGFGGGQPAVLCPHGHWKDGRFMDIGETAILKKIEGGEERFVGGGRSPLQSRCVQLARMGCVVFTYDMMGYADSVQIPAQVAHSFKARRPEMEGSEQWGFFTPQAEARLQNVMGLQTWNSIRALDFLASLPDVDTNRIAVVGESGGATQTLMLCALDERPSVAFAAVMVGPRMQGGCACENASLLRVNQGNIAFAALFAPKPLGMTAADDWTATFPNEGFPQLQEHYAMFGKADQVMLAPLLQFKHNFNCVSRAEMYVWLNKHLRLGCGTPIIESDYRRLNAAEQSVWDAEHRAPVGGEQFERDLLAWIARRDQELLSRNHRSLEAYRQVYGEAINSLIGRTLASAGDVAFQEARTRRADGCKARSGRLWNRTFGESVPVLILEPRKPGQHLVIWATPRGMTGLWSDAPGTSRRLIPAARHLIDQGVTVVGADLFGQGEVNAHVSPLTRNPKPADGREIPALTYGYNYSLFVRRVHDLLSVIAFARAQYPSAEHMDLVGLVGAGHWVAAAGAQAREAVTGMAIDTDGFRFAKLENAYAEDFLPGAVKYGDLPGILALAAPMRLWLAGEGMRAPSITRDIYKVCHAESQIYVAAELGDVPSREAEVARWLLQQIGDHKSATNHCDVRRMQQAPGAGIEFE